MKLLEYKPSTETERLAYEQRWNCKRMDDYRRKKEDLDVSEWWYPEDNDEEFIEAYDE